MQFMLHFILIYQLCLLLDYSIRDPLIPSISPVVYGWIGYGDRLAWYQSRGLGFNFPWSCIFFRCV
jgi:hypothetical protein